MIATEPTPPPAPDTTTVPSAGVMPWSRIAFTHSIAV
jgi:hypothetical protein